MSGLSIGIVGLPNVGKSTLFNALLGQSLADASNYPFCTIEPNVGVVEVPDPKLPVLAGIVKTEKIVPAVIEFVDIAGLVKGASRGEGLGNKFLTTIRNVDAICHVVRDFKDPNVTRAGSADPRGDFDLICTELILKDLEAVDHVIAKTKKDLGQKEKYALALRLKDHLERGNLAARLDVDEKEKKLLSDFFLLTAKPFLIVVNVDEDTYQNMDKYKAKIEDWDLVPISALLEEQLSSFSDQEKDEYLKGLGVRGSGLDRLISRAYEILDLQSFYTAGEKEVRAWTIKKGSTAPQAAGTIHTDFEKGFIMADIVSYSDFVKYGGWLKAKEAGCLRQEGRDYVMNSDDVVEFKFNL